jgi:hypothetical protein
MVAGSGPAAGHALPAIGASGCDTGTGNPSTRAVFSGGGVVLP